MPRRIDRRPYAESERECAARIRLDPSGYAPVTDGYRGVDCAVDFVRLALGNEQLQIQGDHLCDWAGRFYRGRGIPTLRVEGPIAALRSFCPELSEAQAEAIVRSADERDTPLPEPLALGTLLQSLFPDGPWNGAPDDEHACAWLLWLDKREPSEYWCPILEKQAQIWLLDAESELQRTVYAAHDAIEARKLLEEWLGIDRDRPSPIEEPFPAELPERWVERTRKVFSTALAAEGSDSYAAMMKRDPPPQLARVIGEETAQYLLSHKGEITPEWLAQLRPLIPYSTAAKLSDHCPPDLPGSLPSDDQGVLRWFRNEWLPYRIWAVEHDRDWASPIIEEMGREFGEWYLSRYAEALAKGSELLAIRRAQRLAETPVTGVLIWVILDGLHAADATTLLSRLRRQPRFTVTVDELAFNIVPTITAFCKHSLLCGRPPALSDNTTPLFPEAVTINDSKSLANRAAAAEDGSVYVWLPLDPDSTYHERAERDVTLSAVQSQLQRIAAELERAALAVPSQLSVRIVLATDHGRLLQRSKRRFPVPSGMEAHGRAAWGGAADGVDSDGFHLTDGGEVAVLNPGRFRLPSACMMSMGPDMFLTADERSGSADFSHGGVYPEEVLVPWIEIVRDHVLPHVSSTISGRAPAGRVGTLNIKIINPSDLPLAVTSLELDFGHGERRGVPVNLIVAPKSMAETQIQLSPWPSSAEAELAKGVVFIRMPSGAIMSANGVVEIGADEMYHRAISLEDL